MTDMEEIKKQVGQSDSDDDEPENLQYKVILLGNGTVGKTSIINRFCEDYFAKTYKQTIGVDFYVKRLELPDNIFTALQVWDIGGQSIFSKMVTTYIYEANAVIFAYDITNHQSFADLEDWHQLVLKTFEGKEPPLMALMGNKIDLNHMQAVKQEEHEQFAEENRLYNFYVSAKTGDQIEACFYKIAADLSGVKLSKEMIESQQKAVKPNIIDYMNNEAELEKAEEEQQKKTKKKGKKTCAIF
ncbi:unnamed protein product [Moneuplotes crassus]|uniref:Uncharacterized protein n=1 Tax=Euplotes crassus TaxID=5936 RepID=A0AAD1XSI8_EUPCR|nr:unnamed protein product [Moneuplotes crassus]